jgi:hypothetical protein
MFPIAPHFISYIFWPKFYSCDLYKKPQKKFSKELFKASFFSCDEPIKNYHHQKKDKKTLGVLNNKII